MIHAFGTSVVGGNYVVGLVIFLILIVINFMVITKGAGRIAEVAARFTLDAMPGRQMSIDADLGAGLIDETEARRRREEITRYADFYGAMDGAAKFVRGDAVAGLIITAINLVGGFIIGMLQLDMTASEAAHTFTSLSVGDGLVSQIPALIVSTAAGIIVTYGTSSPSVGPAIATQLTRHPRAMWISAGILAALGLVPGFPFLPFVVLAGATASVAWFSRRRQGRARCRRDERAVEGRSGRARGPDQGAAGGRAARDRSGLRPRAAGGREPAGRSPPAHRHHAEAGGARARHRRAARPHPRQHPASGDRVRDQAPRHQGRRAAR